MLIGFGFLLNCATTDGAHVDMDCEPFRFGGSRIEQSEFIDVLQFSSTFTMIDSLV